MLDQDLMKAVSLVVLTFLFGCRGDAGGVSIEVPVASASSASARDRAAEAVGMPFDARVTEQGFMMPAHWFWLTSMRPDVVPACAVFEVVRADGKGRVRVRAVDLPRPGVDGTELDLSSVLRKQLSSRGTQNAVHADNKLEFWRPSTEAPSRYARRVRASLPDDVRVWYDAGMKALPAPTLVSYRVGWEGGIRSELLFNISLDEVAAALSEASFDRLAASFERRVSPWTITVAGEEEVPDEDQVRMTVRRDMDFRSDAAGCRSGTFDMSWGEPEPDRGSDVDDEQDWAWDDE